MSYNDQNTVYHQAAKKLLAVIHFVFGEQNLSFLLKTLPFIDTLTMESLGMGASASDEITEKPVNKLVPSETGRVFRIHMGRHCFILLSLLCSSGGLKY